MWLKQDFSKNEEIADRFAQKRIETAQQAAKKQAEIDQKYNAQHFSGGQQLANESLRAIGGVAPALIPGVGTPYLLGLGFGAGTNQAINEGATLEQATDYGVLEAGKEVAIEKTFGGLKGMKAVINPAKVTDKIGNKAVRTVADLAIRSAGEGVEEGMAAIEQGLQNFQIQLEALGPLAEEALQLLVSVIVEHLPEIIDMGAVLLESLIDGIAAQMPELVPVVVDLILTIVDALLNNLDVLVEAAMQLTIGLATGLVKAAPQLAAKVPQLISTITAALRRGLTQMASIGQELVRGLWNGISNMGAWIGQKIKGFGQNVVNKLKDFFGIKSPSTLMRDEIGKHLATGTVGGFVELNQQDVENIYKLML